MSDELFVSAPQLASWPDLPAVLARAASSETPPTVGQFLHSLVEEDVDLLLAYARQAQQGGTALMGLNLFSLLLANAEGMPVHMEDNLSLLSRRLVLMASAHMLHLQGLLKLDHAQLSLERFDIQSLPLTEAAKARFGGVRVVQVPANPGNRPDKRPDEQ